eukprot:TRINITY_DN11474_c0_g1_i1.p1 TRINITY_DN11474_c0_g1~~TRINITY_DN11474_c0_g1_i1.p1  ORF type:complete len:264 (+),score=67.62 TRINITY_DN11474_c0_g1_i1:316-1107(+)
MLSDFPAHKPAGQQWIYMCVEAAGEYPCFLQLPPPASDLPNETRPFGGLFGDKYDVWVGHHGCADIPALYPMPSPAQMLAPPAWSFAQKAALPPVSYMSSNCREGRDLWVAELMMHIQVASYGRCLHNQHGKDAGGRSYGSAAAAKMSTMARHLFVVAHEGFSEPWYFSEKLWDPYIAGAVPVFVGQAAQLHAERLLPEGSWVDASQWPSVQALAAHLRAVAADEALYAGYMAWKQRPLPEGFVSARGKTWDTVACRMCDALP